MTDANFLITTSDDSHTVRLKHALLAHMHNEMRAPIQAIVGYVELLIEDTSERGLEEFIPDLKKILAAGNELFILVNEILDASKNPLRLDTHLQEFGVTLRHALRNPISAAKGYCELLLEDANAAQRWELIPDLEKILNSCERLLKLLNEIVWFAALESSPPPMQVNHAESETIRQALDSIQPLEMDATQRQLVEGGNVLLVDDDETNRDLLSRRLTRDGHHVITASNGQEGLQFLRHAEFDVVLLDLVMPILNGYQVLQEMKADAKLKNIPVIMLSVLNETDSIVRCIQMGADDYLTKPFNPIILKSRVQASLEKKRLRNRVERLATIGESIAGMAHCVKNILNGINAGSYILESQITELLDSSKISHGWKIAKRNINLLSNIILDMLAYSKERKPVPHSCNLQDLCDDVLAVTQDQATERQIALILEYEKHAPRMALLDEAAIRRCLINLVGNALDACAGRENPRVILKIDRAPAQEKGGFVLSVKDNGCGINEELLAKLFTPFFSTKGNRGTGLGLAVTKKLVQEHGGNITVHSVPNIGTTFLLAFPQGCLPNSSGASAN